MATVAANIATIVNQAAALDTLVTQFRAAKAIIEAAELEIRQAQPNANHDTRAGRIRLADYAVGRMTDQSQFNGPTVASFAASAWAGV
ncbi:hypothetical protein [Tardiphaga sp. 813_E8_N1_3]|uniref:hypothetical protein n=1 Tax=Tardiphaga sp. 813_E8_N1_3 TaxID=3240760 RepID=UPI003F2768A7